MKLQAIKKNCLNKLRFEIINTPSGAQWIGDGGSFWAVDGMRLNEEMIPALFDLTEKQICNCVIREIEVQALMWANREGYRGERKLDPLGMIWCEKDLYLALSLENEGLIMIPERALKPLRKDDEYRMYALRDNVVAVYSDLLCDALICPMTPGAVDLIMATANRAAGLPLWAVPEPDETECAEPQMGEIEQ